MRKLFLIFCLGFLFLIFPVGLSNSAPAIASINSQTASTEVDLPEAIENFLTSLPRDYYTLMKVDALKSFVKSQNAVLIDVRQPSEYASGHIPHAINIPLQALTQNLDKIPLDRPVVLYCTTGYRTAMGVMTLQMLGYTNVRGFPPSIQGWKAASEALEH